MDWRLVRQTEDSKDYQKAHDWDLHSAHCLAGCLVIKKEHLTDFQRAPCLEKPMVHWKAFQKAPCLEIVMEDLMERRKA